MEIQDSGEKVAHIVRVIDGIAFQANILSLNAARNGMLKLEDVSSAFQSLTTAAKTVNAPAEAMRGGSEDQAAIAGTGERDER